MSSLEDLKHRIEALELALSTILKHVPEVKVSVEVPKVILERRPVYVRIGEDEIHGRIILLALDGFLDEWRTAGEVASELLRRGWAPKDFKQVRPALEHLVSLGLLERVMGSRKGRGRKAKWLYRAVSNLRDRVSVLEKSRDT
ncbi:MAG: hypothetical protein B9J98_03450 [Candidatus Terraquivivens tikiterensis]|uniref:Uncharacterized protein n=1 Tax=Candidatus Terraquivivens tikiterensis TaxID=1980982 RepID=A0A2R7Y7W9_9ARCH|nr:MAG: hypothetical protein B9J98_03450 [Candidatus Terraquivivens tikiterensis]